MRGTGDAAFDALALACARAAGIDVPLPATVAGIEAMARRHRVAAPILAALGLTDAATAKRMAALRNAKASAEIARGFEAAGLRAIVLKGAVLAQRLYGDATARDSKDVDILVAPHDMAAAQALLADAFGARPSYPSQSRREAALVKDLSLTSDTLGLEIELHRRLFDVDGLLPRTFDQLWDARETVAIGGVAVAVLAAVDEALYLFGHGAASGWFRLKWVQDIARLLGTMPDALAARIAQEARSHKLEPLVTSAVDLAQAMLGAPVPEALATLPRTRASTALVASARTALLGDEATYMAPSTRTILSRTADQLRLRRDARYRAAVVAHLTASPADRAMLPLPGWAWPLYLPAKPVLWGLRRLRA